MIAQESNSFSVKSTSGFLYRAGQSKELRPELNGLLESLGGVFHATRFQVAFRSFADSFRGLLSCDCVSGSQGGGPFKGRGGLFAPGRNGQTLWYAVSNPPPPGWEEEGKPATAGRRAPVDDATKASIAVRTFLPARMLRQSQCS